MLVIVGGMANADCTYPEGVWAGCDGEKSCCDNSYTTCLWGLWDVNYANNPSYDCFDSDVSIQASRTGCCDAKPYNTTLNCYWYALGNYQDMDLNCFSSLMEPCYDTHSWNPQSLERYSYDSYSSLYVGSSIYQYNNGAGVLLDQVRCPDSVIFSSDWYPPFFVISEHRKMINWTRFANDRIKDLTDGARTQAQHSAWNVPYGEAASSSVCGDDVATRTFWNGTAYEQGYFRSEWYTECVPFFIGEFGNNEGAVCDAGQPTYACCDRPGDCVFNSQCYTSAMNRFGEFDVSGINVYLDELYTFTSSGGGLSDVRTNDISDDYEVCIKSKWVDPDYSVYACEWQNGHWFDVNQFDFTSCEQADRWGDSGLDVCADDPYQWGDHGWCCGDDPKEFYKTDTGNGFERCCDKYTDIIDAGGNCIDGPITTHYFEIQNSLGDTVARFNNNGYVEIAGTALFNQGTLSPPAHSFIVQNNAGTPVFYIDSNGNLRTKGALYQNQALATLSSMLTTYNVLAFQNASNNAFVSLIKDDGGLYLRYSLLTNQAFP